MKILLTGFGPFGDVVDNPSARIVTALMEQGLPGCELEGHVLPVSFAKSAAAIGRLLAEGDFDLAVMLGVARRESEIRIETRGHNRDAARIADCDGCQPEGVIVESGPETLSTPVDVESIVNALKSADIPARLSDRAGGYVCNYVYYAALHSIVARSLHTRCLFIHVPPDDLTTNPPEAVGMPLETQIHAIRLVLEELARAA